MPSIIKRVRSWDLAASTDGDFTVGAKMCRTSDGLYWIEHIHRGQWLPGQVEEQIKSVAKMDGQRVPILIEQEGGSSGLIAMRHIKLQLPGYIVICKPANHKKEVRAAPMASAGHMGLLRMTEAPWNKDFVSEMKNFPYGAHDDQVDACSAAYTFLSNDVQVDLSRIKRYSRKDKLIVCGTKVIDTRECAYFAAIHAATTDENMSGFQVWCRRVGDPELYAVGQLSGHCSWSGAYRGVTDPRHDERYSFSDALDQLIKYVDLKQAVVEDIGMAEAVERKLKISNISCSIESVEHIDKLAPVFIEQVEQGNVSIPAQSLDTGVSPEWADELLASWASWDGSDDLGVRLSSLSFACSEQLTGLWGGVASGQNQSPRDFSHQANAMGRRMSGMSFASEMQRQAQVEVSR